MSADSMTIVFLGLSITSSWGNGHATTYRGLLRELSARGHRVIFLERDAPWYRENRDLASPPYCRTELYSSLEELVDRFTDLVRRADLTVVGSFVPDGAEVGAWAQAQSAGAVAFYDIDTPVTLRALEEGSCSYLTGEVLSHYDLYLSFTGGPTLARVSRRYGVARALPLYCSAAPDEYYPEQIPERWLMGYLGTYSADRQDALETLMLEPARRLPDRRFIVAGPQYPADVAWPENVERIEHIAPPSHRWFYNAQRFALNITRRDMAAAGYSPSVRLFEAAACGTPVISDAWEGIQTFFEPGSEILVARGAGEALRALVSTSEDERRAIGQRARQRVLGEHTAAHRAALLESYARGVLAERSRARRRRGSAHSASAGELGS